MEKAIFWVRTLTTSKLLFEWLLKFTSTTALQETIQKNLETINQCFHDFEKYTGSKKQIDRTKRYLENLTKTTTKLLEIDFVYSSIYKIPDDFSPLC